MRISRACFACADDSRLEEAARLLVPEGEMRAHAFMPQGRSVVRMSSERTAILHSWPERGLVTVDVVGPRLDLEGLLAPFGWRLA